MSSNPRRPPTPGASRKRKEIESGFPSTSTKSYVPSAPIARAVIGNINPFNPAPRSASGSGNALTPRAFIGNGNLFNPAARAGGGSGNPSNLRPAPSSSELPPQRLVSKGNNKLLAGCMAHEFLTKGTLFGQKFEPARAAEAAPAGWTRDPRMMRAAPVNNEGKPKPESYDEVAKLMMGDGAHVPGVVNPTQLARWINRS